MHENCSYSLSLQQQEYNPSVNNKEQKAGTLQTNHAYARVLVYASMSSVSFTHHAMLLFLHTSKPQAEVIHIQRWPSTDK